MTYPDPSGICQPQAAAEPIKLQARAHVKLLFFYVQPTPARKLKYRAFNKKNGVWGCIKPLL